MNNSTKSQQTVSLRIIGDTLDAVNEAKRHLDAVEWGDIERRRGGDYLVYGKMIVHDTYYERAHCQLNVDTDCPCAICKHCSTTVTSGECRKNGISIVDPARSTCPGWEIF